MNFRWSVFSKVGDMVVCVSAVPVGAGYRYASFCHTLATAHVAAGNAALVTPLQPSAAPNTVTLPTVPITPGKSRLTGLWIEPEQAIICRIIHVASCVLKGQNESGSQFALLGPLKEEVVTGVQGSAATAVKVEDGGQIVNHSMGTITKGSKEVANP
ncbi:unnamed protein product [Sphagnum tenellum]